MSPPFRVYNASLSSEIVEPKSDEFEDILEEFGWSRDDVIMALPDDTFEKAYVYSKPDYLVVFQQADYDELMTTGLAVYNKRTGKWTILEEITPENDE